MSTDVSEPRPDRAGLLRRLIPPTPMSRRLALQSLLFSTGDGTFTTGSAVYLTQVVGLSAAQVGLALTIAGIVDLALAYPAGKVVDRFGPKRVWLITAFLRAGCFVALPFVTGFADYVVLAVVFAVLDISGRSAHHAYVLDVLPREERVATQAHLYSALNTGFTLGALLGGITLATGDLDVIRWSPLLSALLMLANAVGIARMPAAPHDLRIASGTRVERPEGPGPLRNRGWMATSLCTGVLWTNQTLLSVVIPLWLVEATDAPHVLLAWLFGTNTVMCIFLPAYTSRGVRTVEDALRYVRFSTAFFVVSCLITMATHSTVGFTTIVLVWLGHVTVTGAELAVSAAMWSFQAELMDPRRRGEYQGVQEVFGGLGSRWSPAVFTFLALEWGAEGWLVIAAIIVLATLAMGPSVRSARRFAVAHWDDGTGTDADAPSTTTASAS